MKSPEILANTSGSTGFDTLRIAFEEAKIKEEGMKMNNMNNDRSGFPFIRLALVGIAGYALWRNRSRLVSLFESTGIKDKVMSALPADMNAGKLLDSGRSMVKEVGSEITKHIDGLKHSDKGAEKGLDKGLDKANDASKRMAI